MTIDVVVKILAVVGGAVVGGLGLGLLAQLLARAFTIRKMPPWPLRTVRLLGGGICGWLVALWLFGGGGAGIGGSGGAWFGSGSGKGEGEKTTPSVKTHKERQTTQGEDKSPASEALRIEVLGGESLRKLGADLSHPYRIRQGEMPLLLTLDEVKAAIKERQRQQPPLSRLEIVLYKDSPDKDVPLVKRLLDWGRELTVQGDGKMKVDISQPDADAPVK